MTTLKLTIEDAQQDPFWRSTFSTALAHLAATGQPFQVDDLRDVGVAEPATSAQWGAAFRCAAQADLIECVGFATARHPEARGRIVRRWRGR